MEAISHAGTAVGILTKDGVVLAAEKKVTSQLLESTGIAEKMYKIDEHIVCAVAGITADANILINYARTAAQQFMYQFQEPTPVEGLWEHFYFAYQQDLFRRCVILSKDTHNLVVWGPLVSLFSVPVCSEENSCLMWLRMGQVPRLPALQIRSFRELWWLEGDIHRCWPSSRIFHSQVWLQRGLVYGGGFGFGHEDPFQDHGLYSTWPWETCATAFLGLY